MSLTTWSVECDYESPLKGRLFQNRDTPLHVDADITNCGKISFFLPNVPNIFPCRLRFSISIHLAKTSARGIETRVGFFRVVRSRIRLSRIFTSCFSVCADMWYIILWSGQCEFHHTVPQRTKTRCRIMSHPKEDGCFKFTQMNDNLLQWRAGIFFSPQRP